MKRILSIALFIAAFVINSQAQEKQPSEKGKHKGNKEWNKKAKEELGLTADQENQMKAINMDFRKQSKAIKEDASLSKEQKKEKLKSIHARRSEKVKAILTPEQQQKVAQHRKNNRKQHKRETSTK
jgi:Spy/CpxP family protein refolding chaperone